MAAPMQIKDWRDEAYYQRLRDSKRLRDSERWRWAWEFLRRNPEYQREWLDAFAQWRERGEPLEDLGSWPDHDNNVRLCEPDPEERGFCLSGGGNFRLWGLTNGYVNPHVDRPRLLSLPYAVSMDGSTGWPVIPHTFRVNLARPLDRQFRWQLDHLRELQQACEKGGELRVRRPTNHIDKYPHYLRLLDARADGLTYERIADALGSDPHPRKNTAPKNAVLTAEKVRKRLKTAQKRMKPAGYSDLRW